MSPPQPLAALWAGQGMANLAAIRGSAGSSGSGICQGTASARRLSPPPLAATAVPASMLIDVGLTRAAPAPPAPAQTTFVMIKPDGVQRGLITPILARFLEKVRGWETK